MDLSYTFQFILSFAGAILWYRFLFLIIPVYFKKPLMRSALKLRWHHLHWGTLLILSGVILLLTLNQITTTVVVLMGIGLGFVVDLFIPSLLLKTDREEELIVYRKSFIPTILFLVLITLIILLLQI